ncbi:serine/threonine-protein kinase HipA [Curtobacterium flaccumfaciens]|uniref:Serine/threonine-protein kinase HipA n=1 Tax=Curtobacterium flaccumfaciens TaxID=2035 RepID=A0A4R6DHC4_9MICO|nr:HipA domain-containing protein [Curtobacterium flaccumfaciens]TDN43960.1 serine/threonine-protein kinase HipA [Curtobacterium flaccumfaciens]
MSELIAYIDGHRIGVVEQSRGGQLTFRYDDDYSPASTPLSVAMPIVAGAVYKHRIVAPFLQGLLPDNNETLEAIARNHHTSARNPFALLRHVGEDTAGALQLLPPEEPASDAEQQIGDIEYLSDDDFEELIDGIVADAGAWQRRRDDIRWSLAGAQPKVALYRDDDTGRWGLPRDATPTTYILKPAGADSRHDVNEFLTMRAARYLGLNVADHDVMRTQRGHHVFVSHRYDRVRDEGGRLHRVHQEDFAQALSVDPTRKYQADGGPGVADFARVLLSLAPSVVRDATEQLFEGLVFSIASVNTDAHAKNYSLLHPGRRTRLAPLYDLGSNVLYSGAQPVESAVNIGGQRRMNRIGTAELVRCARLLRIDEATATATIDRIRGGVAAAFATALGDVRADDGGRAHAVEIANGIAAMTAERGWAAG